MGPVVFNATQIDIDPATGRALAIERIQQLVEVCSRVHRCPIDRGRAARVATIRARWTGAVVPPGPSTVDLHTHSTRSDGVLSPAELIRDVAAAGVRVFSLTDHDTLAGYRDLRAAGAVPSGMTLIPGVEINALVTRDIGLWEWELHILGFGMDPGGRGVRGHAGGAAGGAADPIRSDGRAAA